MKNATPIHALLSHLLIALFYMTFCTSVQGQIPPPGYEREMQMREARNKMPMMERDSITLVDTSVVFDPVTYQEETIITRTRYSLKDYCRDILRMNKPDILLDGKPHTIVDPRTFDDLIIRFNPNTHKIDTLPKS